MIEKLLRSRVIRSWRNRYTLIISLLYFQTTLWLLFFFLEFLSSYDGSKKIADGQAIHRQNNVRQVEMKYVEKNQPTNER